MVLWMTKDAFWAGLLGIAVIIAFVAYNTSRSFKRRYKIVKRDDSESSRWN